jgi:hypothetical protein
MSPASPAPKRVAKKKPGADKRRPVHILSDICADETFHYADQSAHDRADYLLTRAELLAGANNRYNLPSVRQAERFLEHCTPAERKRFIAALRDGRIYVTPVPNQFNTGAYTLASIGLSLEPYRALCALAGKATLNDAAYHMEAPSWNNGFFNLLACAGFAHIGKSLLEYQSPWIAALRQLNGAARLEVAPGRFVWLWLAVGGYADAMGLLPAHREDKSSAGLAAEVDKRLAERAAFPATHLPLFGMYGDLFEGTDAYVAQKIALIDEYNAFDDAPAQLLDSTWAGFAAAAASALGSPAQPTAAGRALRTVRGDAGASWEAWMLAATSLMSGMRALQRDVVSLRTLHALGGLPDTDDVRASLADMTQNMVHLGDHAWNGWPPANRHLNAEIRSRRVRDGRASAEVLRVLACGLPTVNPDQPVQIVNTLGWPRAGRVTFRLGESTLTYKPHWALRDESGALAPLHPVGRGLYTADLYDLPAFGVKRVTAVGLDTAQPAQPIAPPLPPHAMEPVLFFERESPAEPVSGGWRDATHGEWRCGPFEVRATIGAQAGVAALEIDVIGLPPQTRFYDLCWRVSLPFARAIWRGETGGGFVTPGDVAAGGDSLFGIAGSVFAAGEGLSVRAADGAPGRYDFALRESGMCGLGLRSINRASGRYTYEPVSEWARANALMPTPETEPVLYWFLLGNAQNAAEALEDQLGDRHWRFTLGMRRSEHAAFDDAGLYRFAAAFNTPLEIASDATALVAPPLEIDAGPVLPLRLDRRGDATHLALFNCAPAETRVALPARMNAMHADALGNHGRTITGVATLAAHEHATVIVRQRKPATKR